MKDILHYGKLLGVGFTTTMAPKILKGALVEYFVAQNVSLDEASEWVKSNRSIWDSLGPERQSQLKHLASKVGSVDFLTAAWAIEALRYDCPLLASLFLGDPKARKWLARQMEEIKKQLGS